MTRFLAGRFGFVSAAVLVALSLTLAASARAALPPMSDEEKQESSDSIIVGRVISVRSWTDRPEPGYVDTKYKIVVQVDRVEKGDWPKAGQQITLTEFQARSRPKMWGGPLGQMSIPNQGNRVRVYIRDDGQGGHETLEPNGIDTLR